MSGEPAKRHRFLEPLWVRIAIIAFVAAWLLFEVFVTQQTLWMTLAAAMLAYGIYTFLIAWPKPPPP